MAELTRKELLLAVISGRGAAYLRGLDLSALDLGGVGWLFDADLREVNLAHANLSRANLRGAKLENANLHAANLSGANLSGTDLRRTNLVVANLRLTNLNGANMQGANLVGASLANANLENANLEGADLEGANLEGANLTKAKFGSANLRKANLQGAIMDATGLDGSLPDKGVDTDHVFLSSVGFSGSIGSIHLMDLIQLVCLSRSSLVIRVESHNGKGSVHVRKGEIRHAETETLRGEDAFSDMMRWKGGRFETLALPEDAPVSIEKPLEHLLVESMRRYDEMTTPRHEEMAALLLEIRGHIPLGIAPSQEVLDLMRKAGKEFDPNEELKIVDTFFSSDNGEILCSILAGERAFTAPLKLLELRSGDHVLAEKVAVYRRGCGGTGLKDLPGTGTG